MALRKFSLLLGGDYDRTRALRDPKVAEEVGIDIDLSIFSRPSEAFEALSHTAQGDGGEMSLSFFTTMVSKFGAEAEFVGLPVFIARIFRHGNILINTKAGISAPGDLRGKVIALPEYGMTMAVWVRGLLQHEYGVNPEDITWRTGHDPVSLKDELRYPENVDIQRGGNSDQLVNQLSEGEFDAYIGPFPGVLPPNVERLFPNYETVERAYYRNTGIFPIMHLLVVRRNVYERDPDLVADLFRACVLAKERAIHLLTNDYGPSVCLPWLLPAAEEQMSVMGGDLWPYGVKANERTLDAFLSYSTEQELIWNPVSKEELLLPFE